MLFMRKAATVLSVCLAAASCSGPDTSTVAGTIGSVRHTPLADLPAIDADAVLAHTRTLSSDGFEGRGPGTNGEVRTVEYLVDQFQQIGLKPGNPDGTYLQKVPLVGITPAPAPLVLERGGVKQTLRWNSEVVAWTKRVVSAVELNRSELVFVGHGVVSPEYNWDDYKGIDVSGKTLVMLVGDPPVPDPAKPLQLDSKVFGGKAMTYYGRWTYKFEIAAEKGAAGALIIHETEAAGYPFDVVQSSWGGEQFDLITPDKNLKRAAIEGWLPEDQGRDLLRRAGHDFSELKKRAATRDFTPLPLGTQASIAIRNTLRNIESNNVVARLEGADPVFIGQHVVYIAHWDHLGVGPAINGDKIYNGAQDNAVGTAGLLEIARAFTKVSPPPKRSILFLSVTAEEQGLLGSKYYTVAPLYPLAQTLAAINIDGLNVHGRTRDLTIIGDGASELDDYAREAAEEQKRETRADPEPEKGHYFRSDHFSFAQQGVPALDPDEGIAFLGKPPEYGTQMQRAFTERDYHKPSDVVKPDWDLSGAREDLQLFFAVGYRVAQAERFPEWKPGSEFKARRLAPSIPSRRVPFRRRKIA
jgi:Zn-dependent M28 family amino/carboxypeptidase